MNTVIQFSISEEKKALPILLRHSPGTILPNGTYVLADTAIKALRDAGVAFKEIGSDADAPTLEGVGPGERI